MESYKDRKIDLTKPVKVYRNLTRGGYSVKQAGRVVAHATEVQLEDVTFEVNERARQRVVRTGHKQVHAYAVGWLPKYQTFVNCEVRATYNPFKHPCFYTDQSTTPGPAEKLLSAAVAYLSPSGVYCAAPVTEPLEA